MQNSLFLLINIMKIVWKVQLFWKLNMKQHRLLQMYFEQYIILDFSIIAYVLN